MRYWHPFTEEAIEEVFIIFILDYSVKLDSESDMFLQVSGG
jgi:hypothetical protein